MRKLTTTCCYWYLSSIGALGFGVRPLSSRSNGSTVSNLFFQEGDSFTWLYRNKSTGLPSSWERYTIVPSEQEETVSCSILVIQMASKFALEDDYVTHHRMTLNLDQQKRALFRANDWQLDKFE